MPVSPFPILVRVAALLLVACAHAAGLSVGAGMGMTPDFACFLAHHGVDWMQVGLDYGYMIKCMDDYTAQVRASVQK